jgi:hypothetical protein
MYKTQLGVKTVTLPVLFIINMLVQVMIHDILLLQRVTELYTTYNYRKERV